MDPQEQRLADLKRRITHLEADLAKVRVERLELVRTLRTRTPPTTWRRILELTDVTEGFWRRELER